jgi:soluble epoxide hydrolase/lipid-phosphate phosphatase
VLIKRLISQPDSIFSLVFPEEPETWRTDLAPIGAAEAWISANKMTPYPTWLTAEEAATQKKILAQKGYTNALHWYEKSENIKMLPAIRY